MTLTKRTKILCTIGPASESPEIMKKLVNAGMDGIRINTAHGNLEQYKKIIENIKRISDDIPILIDIKGPEIRARVKHGIAIKEGDIIRVGFDPTFDIYMTKDFYDNIMVGNKVLFCNGIITTEVIKKNDRTRELELKSLTDGIIEDNKGVNIPNVKLEFPTLTENDKSILSWCSKNDIDYVAMSFARSSHDIMKVREHLHNEIKIIAKIENNEGLENINEIADAADGIMIARGDLGAEIGIENIPVVQKKIIQACINSGDLCITATQMLESMIYNPMPTRAEVTDVATAVLDGTDCVMLSGETAVGKYPVQAVKIMATICNRMEKEIPKKTVITFTKSTQAIRTISEAVTTAIPLLADQVNASKIVAFTRSGFTATMIARFRYPADVFAVTSNRRFFRQLNLYFGIKPILMSDANQTVPKTAEYLIKHKYANPDETVIFSSGTYKYRSHHSNMIEVHNLGEICHDGKCSF